MLPGRAVAARAHTQAQGVQTPQDAHMPVLWQVVHAGDVPVQAHAEARRTDGQAAADHRHTARGPGERRVLGQDVAGYGQQPGGGHQPATAAAGVHARWRRRRWRFQRRRWRRNRRRLERRWTVQYRGVRGRRRSAVQQARLPPTPRPTRVPVGHVVRAQDEHVRVHAHPVVRTADAPTAATIAPPAPPAPPAAPPADHVHAVQPLVVLGRQAAGRARPPTVADDRAHGHEAAVRRVRAQRVP